MTTLLGRARVVGRAAGLFGLTAGALALFEARAALGAAENERALLDSHRAKWLDAVVSLLGLQIDVIGEQHISPPTRPRLVVSNHRSALDVAVMMKLFPGHFLSRADIATWPVLGRAARRAGTLFVDRAAGHSRVNAVRAIRALLETNTNVTVFPEGTTFAGDQVHEFHAGGFLALHANAEVVPVGLAYEPGVEYVEKTFLAHLDKVAQRPRTRVVACIGPAFREQQPTRQIAKTMQAQVQELVHQARRTLQERS